MAPRTEAHSMNEIDRYIAWRGQLPGREVCRLQIRRIYRRAAAGTAGAPP